MPFNRQKQGRRLVNSCLSLMKQAIERHEFLAKNSRVLVGVSGGIDSSVLLLLLLEYNKRFARNWEIHACYVDANFSQSNKKFVKELLVVHQVPHTIIKKSIGEKIKKTKNRCYPCSRERRKTLLEVADKSSIFQIALAHHTQDAVETLLLNMIYNGELSTLVPKQAVIQGRFFFIRPLYYLSKEEIERVAQIYELPRRKNICPYYQDSKREMIRNFLAGIKKENSDVYKNIFRAIFHVKKSYMP